jgi:hypothetical protein
MMPLADTLFLYPCANADADEARDMQHLQAAFEQQPVVTCQALELAVRGSNPSQLQQCSILAGCCLEMFDLKSAAAFSIRSTDGRIQQPLLQHVLSLQFSCVKLIRAAAAAAAAATSAAGADVANGSGSAAEESAANILPGKLLQQQHSWCKQQGTTQTACQQQQQQLLAVPALLATEPLTLAALAVVLLTVGC